MGYFNSIDTSASALTAQRLRMDTISQNIANAGTTRSENGGPYRRKVVLLEERKISKPFSEHLSDSMSGAQSGQGVRVARILDDPSPFRMVYDPGHPDADQQGYVQMPNVDVISEMVNMISATRAYEANVTAVNTSKSIAVKALEIGR